MSSTYGLVGPDHRIYRGEKFKSIPAYSASKAGIIGLSKWLATWLGEYSVRVNVVTPGGVYNNQSDIFVQKLSNLIPMGRMAEIDEYKAAIVFLLSDASSYMTGQNLVIDGGRTIW